MSARRRVRLHLNDRRRVDGGDADDRCAADSKTRNGNCASFLARRMALGDFRGVGLQRTIPSTKRRIPRRRIALAVGRPISDFTTAVANGRRRPPACRRYRWDLERYMSKTAPRKPFPLGRTTPSRLPRR